jgi:hypothetical protein
MEGTMDFTGILAPLYWALVGLALAAVAAIAVGSLRGRHARRLRLTARGGVRHTDRAIASAR